jgi:N-terminal domain of anti-restriction factor ArdC
MSTTAQQMTADEARDFTHFSVHNAVQAQMACPEGSCEAYSDIFTFRRWRAQGFVVRKGEKGTTVTTWINPTAQGEDTDPQTVKRRPKRAVLFCRHQVERLARR